MALALILFLLTVGMGFAIQLSLQMRDIRRSQAQAGMLMVDTLEEFEKPENGDLRENMGAAAHLIHGSSDGRFRITYAVKEITQEEIRGVGFGAADYGEIVLRYDPAALRAGFNVMPDGEEVFFIPNPALGLWIDRERFEA